MAIKYFIEYNDVVNVVHRLEIYDDTYTDPVIEINGSVILTNADTDDPLESIRGQGLRVELEANSTLTFNDLYSEEQKTFPIIYKRDSITKFSGWLNPEGWFEDYVNNEWKVSFDCIDGLSYLKDLSFVQDSTGLYFTGIFSQLELVSLALIRTGLQQNINIDVQIFYTGLSTSVCPLDNVKARVTRYIKDDNNTIMSCDEVLRDILEPYGACLSSHNGEWYIYKPNQIFNSSILTYHRFDYNGVELSPLTGTLDIAFVLGSDVNGFYPHHANSNQSLTNNNSIGAYRINYKYGEAISLIDNPYFFTTDGITIDDWTTIDATNMTIGGVKESGIILLGPTSSPTRIQHLSTELVGLTQDDIFNLRWRLNCTLPIGAGFEMDWEYRIISTDAAGSNLRHLRMSAYGDTNWATDATTHGIVQTFSGGTVLYNNEMPPLPQDGKILVEIWSASTYGGAPVAFDLDITEFAIEPLDGSDNPLEGEFHTFQRTTKPSKEVKDIREVFTGDSASDSYVGTLYKSDGNTPTETWFRSGVTEEKPILQIMGEETMRLSASVSRNFYGDVYGFFNYLSRVTIDGFTEVFMPIKYRYDTKSNLINVEFRQIYGDELTDIEYQLSLDYGKVVTPTIRG